MRLMEKKHMYFENCKSAQPISLSATERPPLSSAKPREHQCQMPRQAGNPGPQKDSDTAAVTAALCPQCTL